MKGMKGALLVAIAVIVALAVCGADAAPQALQAAALSVLVTGTPAPIETLRRGVVTAVRVWRPQLADAQAELSWTNPTLTPLPAGRSVTVNAGFLTAIQGRPAMTFSMPVAFANVPLEWPPAYELLVSDDPEPVDGNGVLNAATILPSQPVRLLYHHQNASRDRNMVLSVILTNPGPFNTTLLVTGADGGPALNQVLAGHTAARWFLGQYWQHAGFLLTLPPMSSFVLSEATVPPQEVVSGMDQIALQSGQSVRLEVVSSFPDGAGQVSEVVGAFPNGVWRLSTERTKGGVETAWPGFLNPRLRRTASYTVGQTTTLTFGGPDGLLSAQGTGTILSGNYGVTYTFGISMSNPTGVPVQAAP
jgi:hypothetical protein